MKIPLLNPGLKVFVCIVILGGVVIVVGVTNLRTVKSSYAETKEYRTPNGKSHRKNIIFILFNKKINIFLANTDIDLISFYELPTNEIW